MDLKNKIKNLLKKEGGRAAKKIGQHFLISEEELDFIIQSAQLTKKDYVVEIGCGVGNLTEKLCQHSRWVVGVEVDPKMIQVLKNNFSHLSNLKLIEKNILSLNLDAILSQINKYKVVANLPYYISQPVLRYFLESLKKKPEMMIVMLQKEVAEKICAQPPKMSLLTIAIQFYARTEYLKTIPAQNFWPQPKIDSALVKIWDIGYPFQGFNRQKIDPDSFFKIVKAAFLNKRKQLKNSLAARFQIEPSQMVKILKKAGIEPTERPENLKLKNWFKLYYVLF